MVSLRRRKKTLHFLLLSFQRFCKSRVKSCHPQFKKGETKVQRLREAVNEMVDRSLAPYFKSSVKDTGEEQS